MSRRSWHQRIAWGVTIPVVIVGLFLLLGRQSYLSFFLLLGAYTLFLGFFTVWCRSTVPKDNRKTPSIPAELLRIRIGSVDPPTIELLEARQIKRTIRDNAVHCLYCLKRRVENGTWTLHFEECSGQILAYSIEFRSTFIPALDWGKSSGTGVFFPAH
jgi:hypothetical protein